MYFTLVYGQSTLTCAWVLFEARSEKEAIAKAKRKVAAAKKAGTCLQGYHGSPELFYCGPGEYEVWQGHAWVSDEPRHKQFHKVDF